ncbi:MAG: EF-Tu/IF-2/RF-3 family GTPase, partial [bacterium]
ITWADDQGTQMIRGPIPEPLLKSARERREKMLEMVAELDDALTEKYLEHQPISAEEIRAALRAGVIESRCVTVQCGAAFKNKGVQPMLDGIVDYLPSPLDLPPITGTNPETGESAERHLREDAPLTALAFKIMVDPYVGKLCFIRLYSGRLEAGTTVYNATRRTRERIGRLLRMHANRREEIQSAAAGDIVAIVGPKNVGTGDTLCLEDEPIVLESMHFPEPVISLAIEPKTKADEEKMGVALGRLAEEDPTFRVRSDQETGQTIISGMGELHLEVLVDRMFREFNVQARVGRPQVAYKETIRKGVRQEGKLVKQSGGRGQYGHVWLEIEPAGPGKGYEFVNKIRGGTIPGEYISSVQAGVKETMDGGAIAGYPMVDIRVTL